MGRRPRRPLALLMLLLGAAMACSSVAPSPAGPSETAPPQTTTPTVTPTGVEASTCGKLVDYSSSASETLLTLELLRADGTVYLGRFRLAGPGTMPPDLAEQFAAGTPQTLYINGRFATDYASSTATVTAYSVGRIAEACPMTR